MAGNSGLRVHAHAGRHRESKKIGGDTLLLCR